jgi:hypothetical protein
MKYIVFIASMMFAGLSFASSGDYHNFNDVPTGTIVQVGCTYPSATGATVSAIDNSVIVDGSAATTSVPLPPGVAVGVTCSGTLNAFNGASCGHDAKWTVSEPVNLITSNKKTVQQFTIFCKR